MSSFEIKMKRRKVEQRESVKRFYLFCEGTQTEPNYFKGFKKIIDRNPIYKNSIAITIFGVGRGTKYVLDEAKKEVKNKHIDSGEIWCIYDKDSFEDKDFDSVSLEANQLNNSQQDIKYNVAWSNQCIEYWFILHFSYYESNNSRKNYQEYLTKQFKLLGFGAYKKSDKEIFNILHDYGNPKQAIKYAEKRLQVCKNLPDSQAAPATKVHLLVKELAKYLPDDIKSKYL